MKDNAAETKMTNPPTSQTKMVKIKCLAPVKPSGADFVHQAGAIIEVSEEDAKEFCDKEFTGLHQFSGERDEAQAPRSKMVRAVRVV